MTESETAYIQAKLNFPTISSIRIPELRDEFMAFLEQLQLVRNGLVVLSDPRYFEVGIQSLNQSVEKWMNKVPPVERRKLLLLSIICRALDLEKLWPDDKPKFMDDPVIKLFFQSGVVSLAEGTSGVPYGLDYLNDNRLARSDPGLSQLLDRIPIRSSIETLSSEFIGAQPGNYTYQSWQVADWSNDWAVVYGICDGGHDGYPFPWLLGFCHKEHLEKNFVALLQDAAATFDWGFYCTYGQVNGSWPLAKIALSLSEDDYGPDWQIIDDLLTLGTDHLARVMQEGSDDPLEFKTRILSIKANAYDAGCDDETLAEIFKQTQCNSLAELDEKLPQLQAAHEAALDAQQLEREKQLSPFKEAIEKWVEIAAGPRPRSQNAGIGWSIRRSRIKSFLEDYALQHQKLPSGRHNLGRTQAYNLQVGLIDFDQVSKKAGKNVG